MHKTIDPKEIKTAELHQILLSTVAPRPIAFVSSINENGVYNLAPYSFFNCFSSKPPILVFSSNRKVKDNSTKHTLLNAKLHKELVINIVSYNIVRQMALTSIEYDETVSEFDKAGLTPLKSQLVKAPRVAESIVNYECKVNDIIALGEEGGAGHLIICEVQLIHINKDIFDAEGKIDPQKTQLVARMGRAFYCKAYGENVFPIMQPVNEQAIGWGALPQNIKTSEILSANDLAKLAGVKTLPEKNIKTTPFKGTAIEKHQNIKTLLAKGLVNEAWQLLM